MTPTEEGQCASAAGRTRQVGKRRDWIVEERYAEARHDKVEALVNEWICLCVGDNEFHRQVTSVGA